VGDSKQTVWQKIAKGSLVLQILAGIVLGLFFAVVFPASAGVLGVLGGLFVGALKAVAPVLVFILIMSSVANHTAGAATNLRPVFILYIVGTFCAALVAVGLSFSFPALLTLSAGADASPPQSVVDVLQTVLFNAIDNPVNALVNANYIGLVVWGAALGVILKASGSTATKAVVGDFATAITGIVKLVIRFAPVGIMGLVTTSIANTGFNELANYAHLLFLLVGAMVLVALIVNPLLVFIYTRSNPYPLVFTCLRESGITAFFTRSSAANIPVNLALCERLGLDEDTYSVSIPLGATINMAGAAITITTLTLAAAHTIGVEVTFSTAVILSFLASISACGASGVAGGSLLLIPLAASLFGISNDVAMQVVAVGFIIGIVQDSVETSLNSSTDVVFTAAVDRASKS